MCKSYKKPLFCLAIIFPLLSLASCRDTLTPTQPLSDGQILLSSNKVFTLGFFTPNNSNNNNRYVGIWYTNISPMNVFWVANRRRAVNGTSGILSVTAGGNLTITDGASSAVIWSSDSLQEEVGNPVAQLLDSGNFVVTKGNDLSYVAWQSFDYPTDTMIPGMSFIWNLTTGFTRNITAWASPTDPSPGNYTSALDLAGDPQLRLWVGSTRSLRSGPWDGVDFAELSPFNKTYIQLFSCDFVDNKEEVSYTCNAGNTTSTTTLLKLNYEGVLQRILGVEDGEWSVYWQNPSTRCDVLDVCGPYGVCQADELPICSCMPGFVPKSQANWNVGIWSDGCIRKTALDCHSGTTDGFVTMHQMFIPDTVNVTVDRQMSLDECKAKCLRNCSCKAVASANVRGTGTGCITWSMNLLDTQMFSQGGQDLYIRLAAADIESISIQTRKGRKATLAVVLSAVMGTILLAISVYFLWRKRKQNTGLTSNKVDSHREEVSDLPLFDLETIVAATRNFSDENKLGEGGFGPVYKGLLTEGQEIAVKRLSKTSVQGFDELKTEVVLVAKLQHRNLVRLLGCCIQGAEMMLIYEYMANKGLDSFLFDKENGPILNWQTRYKIIHGIARGLLYLHQDSRFRIIHRDLKASNVLLDKDMNPKISDFGLARIFGGDETNAKTRRVVGTYGYMSPEYALNGIFSVKSDVFSFGVLVLEIISGRRNKGVYLSDSQEYLLGAAWTFWRDGNGLQLLDPSMDCSFPMNEVLRCMKVGLLCVQERPEDRPSMSSVVLMLGSHYAPLPEPKQPGFVAGMSSAVEASSSKEHSHSINDVTITMSIAR